MTHNLSLISCRWTLNSQRQWKIWWETYDKLCWNSRDICRLQNLSLRFFSLFNSHIRTVGSMTRNNNKKLCCACMCVCVFSSVFLLRDWRFGGGFFAWLLTLNLTTFNYPRVVNETRSFFGRGFLRGIYIWPLSSLLYPCTLRDLQTVSFIDIGPPNLMILSFSKKIARIMCQFLSELSVSCVCDSMV